jgi:hypothetical protein
MEEAVGGGLGFITCDYILATNASIKLSGWK